MGRPPTQHEVFNPGYNRTSTTYNLQQQNTLKSRLVIFLDSIVHIRFSYIFTIVTSLLI